MTDEKKPEIAPFAIFLCMRGKKPARCSCGHAPTALCDFPLRGGKAGKTCSVQLCDRCRCAIDPAVLMKLQLPLTKGGADFCGPHSRWLARWMGAGGGTLVLSAKAKATLLQLEDEAAALPLPHTRAILGAAREELERDYLGSFNKVAADLRRRLRLALRARRMNDPDVQRRGEQAARLYIRARWALPRALPAMEER